MNIYDELDMIIELKEKLPVYFPFIKDVESYTKYNASSLKPNQITAFIQIMDTRRNGIREAMISNIRLVLVVRNDISGDYALIKASKSIADNINKVNSNNIESILLTGSGVPSYEKDNGTWFRFLSFDIMWK